MMLTTKTGLRRPLLTATAVAAALLAAACGGGDDEAGLSEKVAQGYASDATTMTVSGAANLDSAAAALETGVANPTPSAVDTDMQAQGVSPTSGHANCVAGGSIDWTITGNTSLAGNGQLDAGEVYTVTYNGCKTAADPGLALDGQLQLTVTAWSATNADLTLTATALKGTGPNGSTYTVSGTAQRSRTVTTLAGGGKQVTAHLQKSGTADVALVSQIGTRNASYTLKELDWTIVRTFDSNGALTGRSHSGTLDLAASTPRRPNATLHIETVGALTIDTDGLAAAGHFKVMTNNNTIDCTWGGGSITLALDRGNDGTVDRTWTLTRTVYNGEAG